MLEDGATASARVPTLDGSSAIDIGVRRVGDEINIKVASVSKPWSVLLRGVESVASVECATAESDPDGVRLTLAAPDGALAARL